jgi:hypothetical protein
LASFFGEIPLAKIFADDPQIGEDNKHAGAWEVGYSSCLSTNSRHLSTRYRHFTNTLLTRYLQYDAFIDKQRLFTDKLHIFPDKYIFATNK